MMRYISGDRGFSITELMFAMTILAIGLLAVAQMQIIAMQGTASSRQFSTATNLAREVAEAVKVPGVLVATGGSISISSDQIDPYKFLENKNTTNDTEAGIAPSIDKATDITTLEYDSVEVLKEDEAGNEFDQVCFKQDPDDCDTQINDEDTWDFVRIVNVRNIPAVSDDDTIVKDLNIVVLWKDRGSTRSVSIRTLVGRKDSDFF